MGLAYISRETAAFAVAAFGVLFLAGFGVPRRWYFVIGLGFLALVLTEIAFLWLTTGDPLYRLNISAHHDSSINRWTQESGTPVLIHPLIDPIGMVLFNHYFGLLGWIGVPLAVWLVWRGPRSGRLRQAIIVLATFAGVYSLIAAGFWKLLPLIPRYYLLPSLCVSLLAGIALWQLAAPGRPGRARLIGVGMLGLALLLGNFAVLTLENKNYMFGERALVAIARGNPGVIHTDPETRRRAALLLDFAGLADRVVDTLPAAGDVTLYNPPRADAAWKPGPQWVVIGQDAPPATWLQRVTATILPQGKFAAALREKLGPRHPGVTLYRAG